jgi:D-glycero-alpha-D-manno-heptose-7-phosphate kinase
MTTVTAKAPTRIDLAGGTIDLWPLHSLMEKASTVNVGISVFQKASVKIDTTSKQIRGESADLRLSFETNYNALEDNDDLPLLRALIKEFWSAELPGIHLTTSCESPAGAGLGGSSCLSVAIANALTHAKSHVLGLEPSVDERKIVQTVQNIEAKIINAPTGCQDYWGGVRGRVNILDFLNSGVEIETFHTNHIKDELDKHMVVAFSGKSRDSAMNNWQIFKNVFDGDKETVSILSEIGLLGFETGQALKDGDVMKALEISHKEWEVRKQLWAGIETKETIAIDKAAKSAGAMFSRVCGAGGGGVMVFFCSPDVRSAVMSAIEGAGGTVMGASISENGIEVLIEMSRREKLVSEQRV